MRLLYVAVLLACVAIAPVAYDHAFGSEEAGLAEHQQAPQSLAQEVNDGFAKKVLERIAGHEKEPAGKVFKNIQLPWFKAVPVEDFVSIMDVGYSRALGVACTHCHEAENFASDAKRPKRAAREMAIMHRSINEQLGKMKSLEGSPEDRFVNCAVCHRGAVDPHGPGG